MSEQQPEPAGGPYLRTAKHHSVVFFPDGVEYTSLLDGSVTFKPYPPPSPEDDDDYPDDDDPYDDWTPPTEPAGPPWTPEQTAARKAAERAALEAQQ